MPDDNCKACCGRQAKRSASPDHLVLACTCHQALVKSKLLVWDALLQVVVDGNDECCQGSCILIQTNCIREKAGLGHISEIRCSSDRTNCVCLVIAFVATRTCKLNVLRNRKCNEMKQRTQAKSGAEGGVNEEAEEEY